MDTLLKKTRLALGEVAARTGISRGYVGQLSAGNKKVGEDHAPKLAKLFRERADELVAIADEEAAKIRADAAALRKAANTLDPPREPEEAAPVKPPPPAPPEAAPPAPRTRRKQQNAAIVKMIEGKPAAPASSPVRSFSKEQQAGRPTRNRGSKGRSAGDDQ